MPPRHCPQPTGATAALAADGVWASVSVPPFVIPLTALLSELSAPIPPLAPLEPPPPLPPVCVTVAFAIRRRSPVATAVVPLTRTACAT